MPDTTKGSSSDQSPLGCQRESFSLPPDVHYLNCAFMSPLPRRVEEAGVRGMLRKRNPSLLTPEDFFREDRQVRKLFARLVNAGDPARVAILPSVSYGIGVAARNTSLRPGQNIVLLHEQFPGNVYAWRRLAQETEAEIRTVRPPEIGQEMVRGEEGCRAQIWNERILEAVDRATGVVALAPVHWTDGTPFDLEAIGERCREVGAALVVDGTQSVGALPFDVEKVRPDALIVASYKWLLGPYSIGVGYFGPRYLDGRPLEETWIAREGSQDFTRLVDYRDDYQPGAVRFDVGERSNFILLPMLAAALELLLEWRPERIQRYVTTLSEWIAREAHGLGFTVEEGAWRVGHIFGVRMPPGARLEGFREALERENVSVSLRGSAVRVSPHLYNDEKDGEALIRALKAAIRK